MLSNFHKTTSECWWRTLGTQKGILFSSKGGRVKYKRQKRDKELGTKTHPREGVVKEQKFPNTRKPSRQQVCGSFGISEGNITGREKRKNPQNMRLTATASREVTQRLMSTTSEQRLDREAQAASWVLRVRTRPECPEDHLRELT